MKKIFSLMMIFLLMFNMVNIICAEEMLQEDMNLKYPQAKEKIQFFYDLGIFDFEYDATDFVTRSDFAIILTRLLKADNMLEALSKQQIYTDVKIGDYASENISLMYNMGIMTGKTITEFYPDDDLQLNEAYSALVRLLGYDSKAYAKGGWSVGFNSTASDLGLNKGVPAELCVDYLSAGALAIILFNALDVKIAGSFSTETGSYVLCDDTKTLLYDYWDIVHKKGIINGVENINLYGISEKLEFDEIEIDRKIFKIANSEYKKYIGKKVSYYYYNDDTQRKPEIISLSADINVESIRLYSKLDGRVEGNTVIYYDKEKDKNISCKIATDAIILYNGYSVNNPIFPKNGYMDLISNNSSSYDVVIIYDFQNFIVRGRVEDRVSLDYNAVDKDTGKSYIELGKNDMPYSVIKNGEYVKAEDINIGDVISVAYHKNAGYYVYISNKKAEVYIDSIKESPYTIVSDEYEYRVDSEFKKLIDKKSSGTSELIPGEYYTFKFDFMNNIYGMEEIASEMFYAYLLGVLSEGVFDSKVKVKMMSTLGKKEYYISEKCKLNGITENTDNIYTHIDNFIRRSTYDDPPVVKFKLNAQSEIHEIVTDTAKAGHTPELISDTKLVRSRTSIPSTNSGQTVYEASSKYCNWHKVGRNGTFFVSDTNAIVITTDGDEDNFQTGKLTSLLPIADTISYCLTFYDVDKFSKAPFCIYFKTSGSGSMAPADSTICGVEKIAQSIDEDGEAVYQMYIWKHGDLQIVKTTTDEAVMNIAKTLKKGDFIQYGTDNKGNAKAINKVFSYDLDWINSNLDALYEEDGPTSIRITETANSGIWFSLSKMDAVKTESGYSYMRIIYDMASIPFFVLRVKGAVNTVTFYDGEKFYKGSLNDIDKEDYVFLNGSSANLLSCVVVKNLAVNKDFHDEIPKKSN